METETYCGHLNFVFVVEKMINVTLALLITSTDFDRSKLDERAPADAPDFDLEPILDQLLLSEQEHNDLTQFFFGFCQKKLHSIAKPLGDVKLEKPLAPVPTPLTDAKTIDIKVHYPGKTEVHSLPYIAANEASIDGCTEVLDR